MDGHDDVGRDGDDRNINQSTAITNGNSDKTRKEQAQTLSTRIVSLEMQLGKVASNLQQAKQMKNQTQLDMRRMKRAVDTGRYGTANDLIARRAARNGETMGMAPFSGGHATSDGVSSHFRQERDRRGHTSSNREKSLKEMMSEVEEIANVNPFGAISDDSEFL